MTNTVGELHKLISDANNGGGTDWEIAQALSRFADTISSLGITKTEKGIPIINDKISILKPEMFPRDAFKGLEEVIGRSEHVGIGQRRMITETSGKALLTVGVANCKAIVLVLQDEETLDLSYTLEHAAPDAEPNMAISKGVKLIGKYWINGPASSLRNRQDIEANFGGNGSFTNSGNMNIVYKNHTGLGIPLCVDVLVDPRTKTIYVGYQ